MQSKNSNIDQMMRANEEIEAYKAKEAAKTPEQRASESKKKSFTYKTVSGNSSDSPCRYCRQTGHRIKVKGKTTCPKLIQKERYEANKKTIARKREDKRRSAWVSELQESSGCNDGKWETAGNGKHHKVDSDEEKSAPPANKSLGGRYDALLPPLVTSEEAAHLAAVEAGLCPESASVSEVQWGSGAHPIDNTTLSWGGDEVDIPQPGFGVEATVGAEW